MTDELSDDVIDRIDAEASEAAIHAATPHTVVNPYPVGSREADIWGFAFRSAYAREHRY